MSFLKDAEEKGLERVSKVKIHEQEVERQKRDELDTTLKLAKATIQLFEPPLEPLFEELKQYSVKINVFRMGESQYHRMEVGRQEGKPMLATRDSIRSDKFQLSAVASLEGISILEINITPLVSLNNNLVEVWYGLSYGGSTKVVITHPEELASLLPEIRSYVYSVVENSAEQINYSRNQRLQAEEEEKINRNKPFWKKIIKSNRK